MHVINSIEPCDGSIPITFSEDDQLTLLAEIDCVFSCKVLNNIMDDMGSSFLCLNKLHHILYRKYLRDCEANEYYEEVEHERISYSDF